MNIGIDLRPLQEKHQTGIPGYTLGLVRAILKTDQENRYFLFFNSFSQKNIMYFNEFKNIEIIKTNYPNKILNLLLFLKLITLNKLLPKSIDAWLSPNLNFTNLDKNTKHLQVIHDLSFEIFPEFYTLKQRLWHNLVSPKKTLQAADFLITPSSSTALDISNIYNIEKEKITIIPGGLSENFLTEKNNLETNKSLVLKKYNLPENFILFLGSTEPRKNIAAIIKAYEKLPKKITDSFELLIAGAKGWKNNQIYKAAAESALSNKIRFIGYIPEKEKMALYSLSSLFLFPSFYEGFGLPIIEAANLGIPVITSNRSAVSEISGKNAILVNPNETTSLGKAIENILSSKSTYSQYKKRGQDMSSNFKYQNSANTFLAILAKCYK